MQALHRFILLRSGYYDGELANLRQALQEAAAERGDAPPGAR